MIRNFRFKVDAFWAMCDHACTETHLHRSIRRRWLWLSVNDRQWGDHRWGLNMVSLYWLNLSSIQMSAITGELRHQLIFKPCLLHTNLFFFYYLHNDIRALGMADSWNRWWGGFIWHYFNLDNDGLKMDRALLKKASWLGVQHYAFRLLIKIHCWIIKIFWMRSITHPELQVDIGYNAIRQQDSKISMHELVKRSSCS